MIFLRVTLTSQYLIVHCSLFQFKSLLFSYTAASTYPVIGYCLLYLKRKALSAIVIRIQQNEAELQGKEILGLYVLDLTELVFLPPIMFISLPCRYIMGEPLINREDTQHFLFHHSTLTPLFHIAMLTGPTCTRTHPAKVILSTTFNSISSMESEK